MYSFSEDVLEKVDKINFKGATSLRGKQLHIVGYLTELVYDLALSPEPSRKKRAERLQNLPIRKSTLYMHESYIDR